ncbi:AMP-binding protein [Streptomyces sp. SP18BB07]|uniref:AMP-binding protein n=1 Tax=Streptomyces sp. SP18BB07 TaxID=3002522 RepID=UPI002E776837|nr:AMP-binding protein [Streptomyces sp. SP18BB07]MEE1757626.1 AMP-binding protein [Streptomyces sp. SP18BB07]
MTIADARRNTALTGEAGAPRHRAVNLAHLLTQTARRSPDACALVHGRTRWTWRELDRRVSALAAHLLDLGVRPGQCVMLDGPNQPEYVQAMFAVWRVGAVLAPVNARSHDSELVPIASVCEPVVMIAHKSTASHVSAVESVVGPGLVTVWLEEIGSFADPERDVPDHGVWAGAAAWYFFTSGTSGSPKAAVLTHDQLGFVITNHIADLMPGMTEADRSLVVAPLSHGAGVHLLPQVARGAATVIPVSASLDPAEVWDLVESERIANLFTVPTILKRLTEHDSVHERDHSSLRHVVYAGAPMPRRDQQHARTTLGEVLVQYYGLAEVTGNITVLPPHGHDHEPPANVPYGTCGYPRTGMQISILDAEGNEVAAGETGEICAAGPAVFRGYLNNPEANEAAFRDGWFHTGDVGMLDEQGFLYITGRLSDMYISGGSNIHPREIEEKILSHPALSEAIVLGMPDATWGEVGVAVCVVADGSSVTGEEIRQWLTDRMARYKVPRHVVFWDQLPRSGYGKIVRRTVRELLIEQGWPS